MRPELHGRSSRQGQGRSGTLRGRAQHVGPVASPVAAGSGRATPCSRPAPAITAASSQPSARPPRRRSGPISTCPKPPPDRQRPNRRPFSAGRPVPSRRRQSLPRTGTRAPGRVGRGTPGSTISRWVQWKPLPKPSRPDATVCRASATLPQARATGVPSCGSHARPSSERITQVAGCRTRGLFPTAIHSPAAVMT